MGHDEPHETTLPRFKSYPAYKDSGVGWLGVVPAHWESKRLKYVAPVMPSKQSVKPDASVYVGLENVESWTGKLLLDSQPETVDSVVGTFRAGDVLFGKLRPYLAKAASPDFDGVCTSEILPLRPARGAVQRYIMYTLLSAGFIRYLDSLTFGTKMPRLSPEQVSSSYVPLPPEPEQRRIIAFLDRKTAQIDRLVSKKERLIELLREQRTALITNPVTIEDSNAVMLATASIVFPRVPKGWELRKLRHLLKRIKRPVEVRAETEYREIGIRSWGKGIFHKEPVRGSLLEEKSVFAIEPGDLVLNIVFAWEGAVAVASEREIGMVGSHRFPTFRPSNKVDLDYLLMVLQSEQGRRLMEVNSPGAAGRNKTIRLDQFLDEEIPVPPLVEQREIVQRFRTSEQSLGALVLRLREAIDRLKELRIALISAAVTGKIDVCTEGLANTTNNLSYADPA